MGRTRLVLPTAILSLAAFTLNSCGLVMAPLAGAGMANHRSALEEMHDEAEREGWKGFEVLQVESVGKGSLAFAAYIDEMQFELPIEQPAECWSFVSRNPNGDGSGGGMGSCTLVGEPVPNDGVDWSWSSEDPFRLIGTVALDAQTVTAVFKDGSTQVVSPIRASSTYRRAFMSQLLVQPVDNVKSVEIT